MRRPQRLLPVIAALVVGMALGFGLGCRGRASSVTPASAVTPVEDPSRALPARDDLPAGWHMHEPLRAPGNPKPATLRATADAASVGPNPYVAHTVDVYEPGTGAQAMHDLRRLFRPSVTYAMTFPTTTGGTRTVRVRFWGLSFPKLGDERLAVGFDAADGGKGAFVAIRRGDVITMLRHFTVGTTDGSVDDELTEELARRADERLAQLLNRR